MIEFFGEPISSYSRAQAIEDGVLVDASALVPDEPGFVKQLWKLPVAMTMSVAELVLPTEPEMAHGQDLKGRLWDLLWMAHLAGRRVGDSTDRVDFECIFWMKRVSEPRGRDVVCKFYAVIGPGDTEAPVMTIMLPGED